MKYEHNRKMKAGALSSEDRAYLLGLYFADGCLDKHSRSSCRLRVYLQGDEMEIASRVAEMLTRSELSPHIYREKRCNSVIVSADAVNLTSLFPEKKRYLSLEDGGKGWVSREGLNGKLGVPFIAGLLDGDGCIRAASGRLGIFGCVRTHWVFGQMKYLFLVDFFIEYMKGLASKSTCVTYRSDGKRDIYILASGRKALIDAGIAKWSYKIARYLVRVGEIKEEITNLKSKFCAVSQVAQRLNVWPQTVRKWCKRGYIRHIRIRGHGSLSGNYRYVVPIEEVNRIQANIPSHK